MLFHERIKVGLRVFPARIRGQHRIEVAHHVLDALHGLRVTALEGFLHTFELRIQDFLLEQLLNPIKSLLSFLAGPLVIAEFLDRSCGVLGKCVQFGFAHAGIVGRVGEQSVALKFYCLVEQFAHFLQRAI